MRQTEHPFCLKFATKQQFFAVVVAAKENCLRVFAVSIRVISAMRGNSPTGRAIKRSWVHNHMPWIGE